MPNMLDYLDWFGDVTLEQVPFNEVDNVLLSQLSYVRLEGSVPTIAEGGWVTMGEAAERFLHLNGKDRIYAITGVVSPLTALLPQRLAASRRFGGARLGRLHARLDAGDGEQLAVLQVRLSDGSTYVAFRGTDDTLVGWEEDFRMTYGTVTSQRDAVTYLDVACADLPGPLMVGGHSKGGNLAVYGTALCSEAVRQKVRTVWNNDGPGFDQGVLDPGALARVRDRVRTYVPVFDVVGQLLEGLPPTKVVVSSKAGVMQHDAMSWQVTGPAFVAADPQRIDPAAEGVSAAFDRWLGSAEPEERERRFTEFFGRLEAAQVRGLSDLLSGDPQVIGRVMAQLAEAAPDTRDYLVALVQDLAGNAMQTSMGSLAGAARDAAASITGGREGMDPDTPLSVEEMSRFRRSASRERRFELTARWLGLSPRGLRAVLAGAGAGAMAGVLGWALAQRRGGRQGA